MMEKFNAFPAAARSLIQAAETQLGVTLPGDYVEFLLRWNGGEGFVGVNYLMLWEVESLCRKNKEYEAKLNAPGLLLFGSDGGGEAYAFDTRDRPYGIVMVPFISMSLEDAVPVSTSFAEFLRRLQVDSEFH